MVGMAEPFLRVIQGLLCIAGGLARLSTKYWWAAVCLESVKRKIPLSEKSRMAQYQSGVLVTV